MNRIVHIIIYFLIIGIFILNSPEYAYNLGIIPVRLEDSPFYIKIGKDLGVILLVIIGYIHILYRRKIHINQSYFVFFPIYIVLCCMLTQDRTLCIAGIRWILPFILIGTLFSYINEDFIKKIAKILFPLLLIQLGTQFLELFVMPQIDGTNFLGLAARVPGLFYAPNAAANFVLLSYYIIQTFSSNKVVKNITTILSFVSLLLMMSSTGTFIFILLILFRKYYSSKYFKLFLLISPIIVILIFSNLDTLTGRSEGSTTESGSVRLSILEDCINKTTIISSNFGEATNSAIGLDLDRAFIADSNLIALYHNLGVIGFLFIISIFAYSFMFAWVKKRIDLLQFLIMFFLLNIPAILFEVYPTNILCCIIISYFLKKESDRKMSIYTNNKTYN